MNENNVIKLRSILAFISLLLIIVTLISTLQSSFKVFYPIFYIPVFFLLIQLIIYNYRLKLYRRALLNSSILLGSIVITLFSTLNIVYSPAILFFYYLFILSAIIFSSLFKSNTEQGYIFFEDVRNLPSIVLILATPVILTYGIQLYLGVVKSDFVMEARSNTQIFKDEEYITNTKALEIFREAQASLRHKNLEESTYLLKQALTYQSNNAFIYFALYINSIIENNFNDALEYITKAIETDPTSTKYLCEKAFLLFQNEEYNQIKHLYNTAKKINPHDAQTYYLKANITCLIDKSAPSITYAYLDSAYWYCDNLELKTQLLGFKEVHYGINYYLNQIAPYKINRLTKNLHFYSSDDKAPVIITDKNGNQSFVKKKKDEIITGVKNFIKSNHEEFHDEQTSFIYHTIDNQYHLNIILDKNSKLSIPQVKEIFNSDLFSKKVEVHIVKDAELKYL